MSKINVWLLPWEKKAAVITRWPQGRLPLCLKILFISNQLDHKITGIFWRAQYVLLTNPVHSKTSPLASHQRADMHQNKLLYLQHQTMPTEKHNLPTHMQGVWKVLNWKHNTISTWSRERTPDQRQFVCEKTSQNVPLQQWKHWDQNNTQKWPC